MKTPEEIKKGLEICIADKAVEIARITMETATCSL